MSEPFVIPSRWSDVDRLGHLHHATVVTYLEVGRDAFLAARAIPAADYVVRRCEIDYQREVDPASGPVHYGCTVSDIGTTSLRTVETLLDEHGTVLVEARFVLVLWDGEAHRSRPVTDRERAALQDGVAAAAPAGRASRPEPTDTSGAGVPHQDH